MSGGEIDGKVEGVCLPVKANWRHSTKLQAKSSFRGLSSNDSDISGLVKNATRVWMLCAMNSWLGFTCSQAISNASTQEPLVRTSNTSSLRQAMSEFMEYRSLYGFSRGNISCSVVSGDLTKSRTRCCGGKTTKKSNI